MNDVCQWLVSGAGVPEGLRLLSKYAPNIHLDRLVRMQPSRWGYLLSRSLSRYSDEPVRMPASDSAGSPRSFREEWPFLSEPDCPPELKILAADKITAYHEYVRGHEELFSCITIDECYNTAKKVVENYKRNRKILSEFAYYREHGKCLGKHEIFASMKRLESLRRMSPVELVRKQKNLSGAIWRIKNELKKGDKPHLRTEREARLKEKSLELSEVNRLLGEYEKERDT